MQSFKTFITEQELISEKVLSIGLNPEHEQFREKHRQQIHDVIHNSYKNVEGGYGGQGSGSKKESDAIHDDISNSVIKATKRGDKITAVNLYKKQHGRKSIASGTDGSEQGKHDWKKTKMEDHEQKRAWGEVSGAAEKIQRKMGVPVIPNNKVGKLLNKDINPHEGGEHYERKIGGETHTKVAMGHPKSD
jgi:hypothetical protein